MSDALEPVTPEENESSGNAVDAAEKQSNDESAKSEATPAREERRKRRRALISAPVRVRRLDVTEGGPDEITTTTDVSRNGLLFLSSLSTFELDMEVAITFPYSNTHGDIQAEQSGRIVRLTEMEDGRRAIAVAIGTGVGDDIVDAAGRKLLSDADEKSAHETAAAQADCISDRDKPLVLVVDADQAIRDSVKSYLTAEGYKVIAVGRAADARDVLKMFTPALLIAEIEGEELPGFELCAHIKATPHLKKVPVMMLTRSAYPSDYANAHSLGAVVCMAKPFRQERLGHVVRLLAPTQQAKQNTAPARRADVTRLKRATNVMKKRAQDKRAAQNRPNWW